MGGFDAHPLLLGVGMIRKVIIHNFQSHKHSEYEFCPTTNSIVGPSNNGKTAVLRAINWAITNRPSGEAYVSHWARDAKDNQIEDTYVTIETDSHIITRTRGKKGNTYTIDGKILDAVGLDVPEEIAVAFNMSEVNIQKQMDSPFLLSETPGEVARFFNKIVHLDKIDIYLTSIESKKRKCKTELEILQSNKVTTEKELSTLTWVDKASEILATLQEVSKTVTFREEQINTLAQNITDYNKMGESISAIDEVLSKAANIITIFDHNKNLIIGLKTQLNQLTSSVEEYKKNQISTDTVYAEKLAGKIERLNVKYNDLKSRAMSIIKDIKDYEQLDTVSISKNIEDLIEQLPDVCPMCGGKLEHNSLC